MSEEDSGHVQAGLPQAMLGVMPRQDQTRDVRAILNVAIRSGLNVLIEGHHGIGKSSIVLAEASTLGLALAYYNAATLDPFVDLVGIPVPIGPEEQKRIRFLRPDRIGEAQVVCFDDLNRAASRVLNAVFELVQFRSINGEPLPKLRSVIGIINPANGEYQVQELDPALVDRFHVFVGLDRAPSRDWFIETFGAKLGSALVDWYALDLDEQQRTKLSPRRLEYLGRNLQHDIDPGFSFLPGAKFPLHLLKARLREDPVVLKIEDFLANSKHFESVVSSDLNAAVRFSQVLPLMRPQQKVAVKWIVAALPCEALASIQSQFPFLLKEVLRSISRVESKADADAYRELLNEKLATPIPP